MRSPRVPSAPPAAALLLLAVTFGCVTEEVPERVAAPVRILDLPVGVLPAGAYHGVTFFFEIDLRPMDSGNGQLESQDLPDVARWNESERGEHDPAGAFYRQLPPITPEIEPGGREVYRLRDIHRVDYYNSMFEVGGFRYLRMSKARLYVFKRQSGRFSFRFRGQEIAVDAEKAWTPSMYYYAEEEPEARGKKVTREVLQVGLATVENFPAKGYWLVDGKRFIPGTGRPLELESALRAVGTY